eukprot:TRINITY_DN2435_c0_g2_i1.p1 TRINITY_DN2435_c0_g2~~TRINITY_DN2435_c0_g2_i1.p1  ORF type:complete len:355 (+),score=124.28 TRINITY_DN2435_c0_g2_i1:85-1149(+)
MSSDGGGQRRKKKRRNLGLQSAADVAHKYDMGPVIGQGSFATVRAAVRKSDCVEVAVKEIEKQTIAQHIRNLKIEIGIHEHVDHPDIVRLLDTFEDDTHVYLVMERMAGGELLSRLIKEFPQGYGEDKAKHIIRGVLEGVRYLHKQGIVHRDLKPENILFADMDSLTPKISDFGLAQVCPSDSLFQTPCGSPNYVAPEIIANSSGKGRGYTFAVDMWSIGCISYVVLCGFCPFTEDKDALLFKRILTGDFSFPSPVWDSLSKEAVSFVAGCLTVNPTRRLTPDEALQHPWLAEESKGCPPATLVGSLKETVRVRDATKLQLRSRLSVVEHHPECTGHNEGTAVDFGAGLYAEDE